MTDDQKSEAQRRIARVMLAELPERSANLMETANDSESATLLDREAPSTTAAVIRHLTPDRASRILARLTPESLRGVTSILDPSRAAALLARLDEEERNRCLSSLDTNAAEELTSLAQYPTDTAGSMMDPRVTTFRPGATVRDVVDRLRTFRDKRISDVFLVGEDGKLAGVVALQDVVLAESDTPLAQLSQGIPAHVQAVSSRDQVIESFETHRISNLPVVDFEGRLIGVLRQREIVHAAQEGATASAVTMVGASGDERALSPALFAIRKRLPWLQVNLLTAFLAASVVGLFEDTIAKVTALAVLLPVVAGQSGNTGAQALAVTMRGLALREIRTRHWYRVAIKEMLAGAGNGIAVALTTALAVYLWSGSIGLATVIGVSMVISMILAGLAGASIPVILVALRQDPAQSSSIILTTVTDVAGFFSFLGIATMFMSLL